MNVMYLQLMNVSKYALNQRFFLAEETEELFYLDMES